jgi:DNA-binding transcriptional regulator LsrR (DeoR family)
VATTEDNTSSHVTPSPVRTIQMLDAARRFYLEMEPKVVIAEALGVSRYTVSRLLHEAKDAGYVRIEIQAPTEVDMDLSRELAKRTKLERAFVMAIADPTSRQEVLSHAAASYLADSVTEDDVLGLEPGRTTAAILDRIPELPPCTMVQISGIGPVRASGADPLGVIRQLSSLSSGELYPLYAPLLLDSPELVETLREQIGIAESVAQFERITRMLFAVGKWSSGGSTLYDIASDSDQRSGEARGVTAEVAGHLLDRAGQEVFTEFSSRCLSISYEQIMRVGDRVAIGWGGRKDAVLAAVRSGLITTLATDIDTATYILENVS